MMRACRSKQRKREKYRGGKRQEEREEIKTESENTRGKASGSTERKGRSN